MNRFDRQIMLSGFGEAAQLKLQQAKVLVVGAGGLGCPVLLYLAAAGVGTIGVSDGDVVSVSNLNRQIIFSEADVNKRKAEVAGNYLKQKYNDLQIEIINTYLTVENTVQTISKYDLVIDGSDNFQTRYMINDACVLLRKPLVFGAVYQQEGQVAVFNVADGKNTSVNYRDVFPSPPSSKEIPDCNQTGVLGVLPGIIGVMMASETIKLLTGFGKPLVNKMLFYNLITNSIFETEITPNPSAENFIPKTVEEFNKTDYTLQCRAASNISWDKAIKMKIQKPDEVLLLDVREPNEQPKLCDFESINISLQALLNNTEKFSQAETILVFCQSGIRSQKAVIELSNKFSHKKIYSIDGGILKLNVPANT